jgi:hypothetical protein
MTHPHYLLIQSKSKSSSSKPIIVDELEDSDFEDDDKKSRIAAPGDKKRRLKSKQDIEVEKKAKKVTKSAITPSAPLVPAPATVPVPEPALKAGKEKNITPTLKANDVVDMTENKMTKKDASNNSNSNSSSNSNSQAAKKIMSPSKALKRKEVRINSLLVVIVLMIIFLDNRCLEVRDHFLVSPRLALKIVLLPILQPSAHHLDLNPHQHQIVLPQVVGRLSRLIRKKIVRRNRSVRE